MNALEVRWTAAELVDHFTCAHRVTLERAVRAGRRERPAPSGEAAVVARRGLEHEAAELERLRAAGVAIETLVRPFTAAERSAAVVTTRAAFAAGADAVVDATLGAEGFSGVAGLVVKVPGTSAFGPWAYEVVELRLGARSEPAAIVRACALTDALASTCGSPFETARFRIVNRDGIPETHAVAEYAAFYRALRNRLLTGADAGGATRPDKIAACARCRWRPACAAERAAADDVGLVANIRRTQVRALRGAGYATLAALAGAPPDGRPGALPGATWEKLREQASLQAQARADGVHRYRLLVPDARSGFALLPPAAPGDVYFDMEGDPFVPDGGLEYLFGCSAADADGTPRFTAFWALDRTRQRAAARAVLDLIEMRRAADPAMHVYHYAPYERTALARLTLGTPDEARLDALFRERVFVDLYEVVRGGLRVSTPSYSIKSLELFYRGHKRTSEVADALGSVVAFEEYLRTGDAALLEPIRVYNQDDCDSTRELHGWLLERKAECYARYGVPAAAADDEEKEGSSDPDLDALRATLADRLGPDALLGDLLAYHRREARPVWREFFERLRAEPEAHVDDPACLGGLRPAPVAPVKVARSHAFALDFPPQAHAFRVGDTPVDPATRGSAGTVHAIETYPGGGGRITLKRGAKIAASPLPTALIPRDVVPTTEVQAALRRFGEAAATGGGSPVQRALLARTPPALRSGRPPAAHDGTTPDGLADLIDDLAGGVLIVQGPPGTGKTWIAARAIVRLLVRGRRIGVASGTHKAINNLLAEIEAVARETGYVLRGVKRSDPERPETCYAGAAGTAIADLFEPRAFPPEAGVRLIAGTPALFAREAMAGAVDVLVVDEAGQMALADAIALAQATGSLVLAGDPQQLPHVTVGAHPTGAGVSVLGHLLAGAKTVPPERGVFLPCSFRLHPTIARFVSELMYDGRLTGAPGCARQRIVLPGSPFDGAGLRALPVAHEGRSNASPEEAAAVRDALVGLTRADVIGPDGVQRPIDLARDAIVVAPYNAQVAAIRVALAGAGLDAVRVGTVDKFQGQEASVVLYSMATSSGDDVPRDVEFLFDRHRLNVAVSRARALAVAVHSPALLRLQPRTVDELRLLNALARFVELATGHVAEPAA